MTDSQVRQDPHFRLEAGRLYLRTEDSQLLRLVCLDSSTNQVYFLRVALQWNSTPKQCLALDYPEALAMGARQALVAQDEVLRLPFMLCSDAEIRERDTRNARTATLRKLKSGELSTMSPEELRAFIEEVGAKRLASRDVGWRAIEPLVSSDAICATYNPRTSFAVVSLRAEALRCSVLHLQRLLHRYAWFGLHMNALLLLYEAKGLSGAIYQTRGTVKRGRPNAAVKVGMSKSLGGVNVTARDIAKFIKALKQYWVASDETFVRTYKLMCWNIYIGITVLSSGERIVKPIDRRRVPTLEQFRYYAAGLCIRLGLIAAKKGHVDAARDKFNPGRDFDIAREVGDVFDTDGTEFNFELIADFTLNGKTVNIGKPTVVLIFDRRSRKVVGWHVYIGHENWKEGYRLALFLALTSKKKRLAYLGIEVLPNYPLWVENVKPRYMYSDNGAFASEESRDAQDRLGISPMLAPPGTPYWKPTMEGGLGNFQAKHAKLAGGYQRTRRARDKDARRFAKRLAERTLYAFEQRLVLEIIEYNAALTKGNLLSYEMTTDGNVEPSSDSMFRWGVRRIGGASNRTLDTEAAYLALLSRKPCRVTQLGISHDRAHYWSDALGVHYLHRGSSSVLVLYNPMNEEDVFWMTPDGLMERLTRREDDDERHRTRSSVDIEALSLHQKAEEIKARKMGRSAITQRQQNVLNEHAGKPKVQRPSPTRNQAVARAVQATKSRAAADLDRADNYLPGHTLAPVGSPACPSQATSPGAVDLFSSAARWDQEDDD